MLMLAVFPLFTGFEGYTSITEYKYGMFLAATAAWLLPIVWYVFRYLFLKRKLAVHMSAAQWSALAFFAASAVSAVLSPYSESVVIGAGRYDGLLTLALYCGIFLGVSAFGEPRRKYVLIFAASMLLCSAVAIFQLFGKNALSLFPDNLNFYDGNTDYTGEFLGTIGNTNLLSGALCLLIPLCIMSVVTWEKSGWYALLLAGAGAGMFVLCASGVAGGAVALAVFAAAASILLLRSGERVMKTALALFPTGLCAAAGISMTHVYEHRTLTLGFNIKLFALLCCAVTAVCAVLYAFGRISRNRLTARGYSAVFAAAVGVVILAGLAAVYSWSGEQGTLYEFSQVLHGNISDKFGSSRIRIWRAVLGIIPERPLLGGGPDTLALRLNIEFTRYIEELDFTRVTYVDNAHNEYLGYLANLGALGLAAYVSIMVCSAVRMVKTRDVSGVLPGIGCAVLCYWAEGLFGLGLCITAPLFWILWGLFESRTKESTAEKENDGV